MAELARSAKQFGAGIVRRLWALIPGVVFGLASVYDTFVKPYLPPDWQKVSLAVPLSLVLALLGLGVGWAALLTYHELRIRPHGAAAAVVHVGSGGTYVHAPGATLTFAPTKRSTRVTRTYEGQMSMWVTLDENGSSQ